MPQFHRKAPSHCFRDAALSAIVARSGQGKD
jgi:hypothetical protein